MPPNQKNKWVIKIKCNGVYQACLIAWGYSQVPGINFSENYSPVVNDVIFRIIMLMLLHFGYSAKIVDVETAFLYGDLYGVPPRNGQCKKGQLHHFEQMHLWPCSSSLSIL